MVLAAGSQIIRMIKPVEYFGYRAYFAKEDYVTAAAAEPFSICLIPMSAITTLVTNNNDLAMFFIKQLSIDLGIADERTVNLTQKHIRGRLAESLLFLKERLWTGRRRFYPQYLSVTRRSGKLV